MMRLILLCAVLGASTGCGATPATDAAPSAATAGAASTDPVDPTPDPTPAATPTPSPSPTPSVEDLARAYIVVADAFNATICEGNAVLNAAESDAEYFEAAMTAFGAGVTHLADLRDGLAATGLGDRFPTELDALLDAIDARRTAYQELVGAANLDEAAAIFDTTVLPANERMDAAGQAMRTALGLPPRPEDACERETAN